MASQVAAQVAQGQPVVLTRSAVPAVDQDCPPTCGGGAAPPPITVAVVGAPDATVTADTNIIEKVGGSDGYKTSEDGDAVASPEPTTSAAAQRSPRPAVSPRNSGALASTAPTPAVPAPAPVPQAPALGPLAAAFMQSQSSRGLQSPVGGSAGSQVELLPQRGSSSGGGGYSGAPGPPAA